LVEMVNFRTFSYRTKNVVSFQNKLYKCYKQEKIHTIGNL
jgi:hypothetical protein